MSETPFMLEPAEVTKAVELYGALGEKTADGYQHLGLTLKRTAATVVIGVVRHMTPRTGPRPLRGPRVPGQR